MFVNKVELDAVVRWLWDQGFNISKMTTLPTGETELTIRLPK